MLKTQKQILPHKLQKLTIKLKSFAFMKIFMIESSSPKKYLKVRHYDLQLEGASAISGWLKTKLQQVYLRHFLQMKQFKKNNKSLVNLLAQPQYLSSLQIQNNTKTSQINLKKSSTQRIKCRTDRQTYQKSKQSKNIQPHIKNSRNQYRSQYGQQSQLSQKSRKSNLQSLLNKVRQANNQSKIDKENSSKSNNFLYQPSYDNSRVLSTGGYVGRSHHEHKKQSTKGKSIHNDMSFCNYGNTDRVKYTSSQVHHYKQFQTPGTPGDKMSGYINIEQEGCLDKNNLMSLKKWHRNQKRNVIINKIKDLQSSLYAQYSRPEEYYFNEEDDFYPATYETYEIPTNYSQAYLNFQTRQPTRSVIDMRLRK